MPKTNEIDNIENEDYTKMNIYGTMEYLLGESLLLFGWQKYHQKKYRLFYGVGVVYRVVKGEKQDLVYVRFGAFPTTKIRLVVAYHNHARRQTLTLKRGQHCQVYGICRYFSFTKKVDNEEKRVLRLGLYATAIQGWYVPSMLDIRKLPNNEDIVAPTEKEEEIQQTFDEILNEFMNGKGEEDE